MSEETYKEGDIAPEGIGLQYILNRSDGSLPFGLFHPESEGNLTWICNTSQTGQIVGVFNMNLGDRNEKQERIYANIEEARMVKDGLEKEGWQILIPPKVEFTIKGKDGKNKPLGRKERRLIERKIKGIDMSGAAGKK